MINFNPPGTEQQEAPIAPYTFSQEARILASGDKCGICGGTHYTSGKIAGLPEAHCATCRTWLRDAIRFLFFTTKLQEAINGKA